MGIAPESWPAPFRTLIRTSNKYLLNPLMLRLAGRRFWYASVIRHTGRRSDSAGQRSSGKIVAGTIAHDTDPPVGRPATSASTSPISSRTTRPWPTRRET